VIDTRGDFLDFKPAVVFGTLENPPAVDEVLTALEKPDVQTVVCLAAVLVRLLPIPVARRRQWVTVPASAGIAAMGLFWAVQRLG